MPARKNRRQQFVGDGREGNNFAVSDVLEPGTTLGRYRLGAVVGEGGMGRVYHATDETLHRRVAVKVIHGALTGDASATARFEREALAVAALSHPNIVALHDVGTHDGTPYAVMELLDGETLRARLAAGPLPPRKTVEYGVQIARALAAAHGRGILHRDIKPDNIFLTRDGHVKVLDFGLAALNEAPVAPDAVTHAASTPGLILGTPGYMAPEQLRGGEVDERTDIFAFGAVLYEMLSGRRAFTGASHADLVSAILQTDPQEIPGTGTVVPSALYRVVRRCLEKNPNDRFHSAQDLAFALEAAGSDPASTSAVFVRPHGRSFAWLAIGVATAALVTLAFFAGRFNREIPAAQAPPARFSLPVNTALIAEVAVSPDGRLLAWTALPRPTEDGGMPDAATSLWVRQLDSTEVRGIPGTSSAVTPVFSPDGRELWFIEGNLLSAADVTNGRRRTIFEIPGERVRVGRGFAMNAAGDILLALDNGIGRTRGGPNAPTMITVHDASRETGHRWPTFLPDGRRFLYLATMNDGSNEVRLGSLDGASGVKIDLPREVTRVMIDPAGYLLFGQAGAVYAQAFDLADMRPTGRIVRVADGVPQADANGWFPASVSSNGVLAYREAPERPSQFEWVDRGGHSLGKLGLPDAYNNFDLSPDGTRLVAARRNVREGNSLHLIDTVRGSNMTWVNTGRQSFLSDPTWSPDGQRIAYRDGGRLMLRDANGSNERVLSEQAIFPDSWQRHGPWLLAGHQQGAQYELIAIATDGSGKIIPLVNDQRIADEPRFSPDGKWVLYHAVADRRPEVFLIPFPPTGEKWQMSVEGGVQPRWRADGREFYYLDTHGRLMAVAVPDGNPRNAARPQVLTDLHLSPSRAMDQYATAPDGSKFLVRRPVGASGETVPVEVLINWRALFPELRER